MLRGRLVAAVAVAVGWLVGLRSRVGRAMMLPRRCSCGLRMKRRRRGTRVRMLATGMGAARMMLAARGP